MADDAGPCGTACRGSGDGGGTAAEAGEIAGPAALPCSSQEAYAAECARLEASKAEAMAKEDYHLAEHLLGQFSLLHAARAAQLEKDKARAVESEDYDLAKRLKCEIEALGIGKLGEPEAERRWRAQLAALEDKKARAVADEDFELAKSLKVEIEALRQAQPADVEAHLVHIELPVVALTTVDERTVGAEEVERAPEAEAPAAPLQPGAAQTESEQAGLVITTEAPRPRVQEVIAHWERGAQGGVRRHTPEATERGASEEEEVKRKADEEEDEAADEELGEEGADWEGEEEEKREVDEEVDEEEDAAVAALSALPAARESERGPEEEDLASAALSALPAVRHGESQVSTEEADDGDDAPALSPRSAVVPGGILANKDEVADVMAEVTPGEEQCPEEDDRPSERSEGASPPTSTRSPPTTATASRDEREEDHADDQSEEALEAAGAEDQEHEREREGRQPATGEDSDDEIIDVVAEVARTEAEDETIVVSEAPRSVGAARAEAAEDSGEEILDVPEEVPLGPGPPQPPASHSTEEQERSSVEARQPQQARLQQPGQATVRPWHRQPAAAAAARAALRGAAASASGVEELDTMPVICSIATPREASPSQEPAEDAAPEEDTAAQPVTAAQPSRQEATVNPVADLYSFVETREPRAAMRVGKKVKITGNGPYQGRIGTVVGFDEDGDPELRLEDGDSKVFYRRDVSVLNEVRRRVPEPEPQPPRPEPQAPVRLDAGPLVPPAQPAPAQGAPVAAPRKAQVSRLTPPVRVASAATKKAPEPAPSGNSGDEEEDKDFGLGPVRVSFTDELRLARVTLARAKGHGRKEGAALLAVAELELACGNLKEALELATQAVVCYEEAGEQEGAVGQARATRLAARIRLAEEAQEEALELCRARLQRSCSRPAEAILRLALAEVHGAMERPREALRDAEAALRIARELKDQAGVAASLQAVANANLRLGSNVAVNRAKELAEEALALHRAFGEAKEESAVLLIISRAHALKQEQEEAYGAAESALAAARRAGCKRAEATAQREIANVLLGARLELDMALQAAEDAVRLSSEIGDLPGEIASRHVAASAFVQNERIPDAMDSAETALSLARELKDRRHIKEAMEVVVQLRVGDVQTDKALEAAQEELDLAKEDGSDPRRILVALQRVAALQFALEDADGALKTAEAAVAVDCGGDRKAGAWGLQLMAEVQLTTKRYEEALASANKALAVLQEERDVRAVASILQMTFELHAEMGNESEAIRARQALRLAYQAAGWKDEEAALLLSLAELILQVRGPRDASKAAKEAMAIFKELEDKAGEANGMLALAQCQVASKASTDALRSTVTARRLFQSLNDAAGEAQSLLTAADVYSRNGAADEAVRVAREAQKICQKSGEQKVEADALQTIAAVRIAVLQKEEENGRRPKPENIKETVEAAQELIAFLEPMPDTEERRINCLVQSSSLKMMLEEHEAALRASEDALELAVRLDKPLPMGHALLAMSEAHCGLGNSKEAQQAAEDAVSLFEQIGDTALVQAAKQAVEAAKKPVAKSTPKEAEPEQLATSSKAGTAQQGDTTKRPRNGDPIVPGFVHREMNVEHSARGPQVLDRHASGPHRTVEMEPERRRVQLRPPSPVRNEPDQEKRRQQLLAAMEARAQRASLPPETERPRKVQSHLRSVLQKVRPDWSGSDLAMVQEKLASIQIHTFEELVQQLNEMGARGVNQKLKDMGKKPLKTETLDALKNFAKSEADD